MLLFGDDQKLIQNKEDW